MHKHLYGKKETQGKVWITDEILHLIEERRISENNTK